MIINHKKKADLKENDILLRTTDGLFCKFICNYDLDKDHSTRILYYFKHFNDKGGFIVSNRTISKMFETQNNNLCIYREADYI